MNRRIQNLPIGLAISVLVSSLVHAETPSSPDNAHECSVSETKSSAEVEEAGRFDVSERSAGIYRVTGRGDGADVDGSDQEAERAAVFEAEIDAFAKLVGFILEEDAPSAYDAFLIRALILERLHVFMEGVKILETRVLPDGSAEVDVELVLEVEERDLDPGSSSNSEMGPR